jgi:hypothetical protein
MTVRQLIKELKKFDQNLPVGFDGEITAYVQLLNGMEVIEPPNEWNKQTQTYTPTKQKVLMLSFAHESRFSWHKG